MMDKRRGSYLGTEIDGQWWRRYARDGLLMRGNGEYWYDEEAFYFLRHLVRAPIVIPFASLTGVEVTTWHAGRWVWGHPIVVLSWEHEGQSLASGFVLARDKQETQRLAVTLAGRCRS